MDDSAGRDAALPYWRDATPTTELQPWAPGAVPGQDRNILPYMHYPVNREQADEAVHADAVLADHKPVPQAAVTTAAEVLRPPPIVVSEPAAEE
jgi:hypothetical protein